MKITQANSYCNNINTTLEKNTFLLHTFSKLQTLLPRLLRSRLLFLPKTVDGTPGPLFSIPFSYSFSELWMVVSPLLLTLFSLFLRFPPKVENGAS